MRIITGIAKGRILLSPLGNETRPTLDRIKQSMFNIIQFQIPGKRALDVFAGTGSLGLEAVSRGASYCVLVDKSPNTFPLLKKNVENLGFTDKCKLYNEDSYEVLKKLGNAGEKFDIIFIDPPYMKDMIPPSIALIEEYGIINHDGIIVTKIDTKEEVYEGSLLHPLCNKRVYGNTTVCIYKDGGNNEKSGVSR